MASKIYVVDRPFFSQYGKQFVMSPLEQVKNSWVRLQSSQISGLNMSVLQKKVVWE